MAWIVSWPSDWKYDIGVVGATGEFIQIIFDGLRILNWGSFVLLSMPVGTFIAAWQKGKFRCKVPNLPSTVRMLAAGLVMGVGATFVGGCNICHDFIGIPTLAISCLTAAVFTFLDAWLGNYLRFIRAR